MVKVSNSYAVKIKYDITDNVPTRWVSQIKFDLSLSPKGDHPQLALVDCPVLLLFMNKKSHISNSPD